MAAFGVLQTCFLQQARLLAVGAGVHLAVHEQRQALLEAHAVQVGLAHLFLETGGESFELQCAQLLEGGVVEHGRSSLQFGWMGRIHLRCGRHW